MPRKQEVIPREPLPDPKYHDRLVSKFVNSLMGAGKKSVAEKIMYDAFDIMQKRSKEEPIKIFKAAIENVKPVIEVKSRRVGGSTYQVPVEVRSDRRLALAIRWIISFSKKRGEKSMRERLANEFLDAANGRGASFKKKEDTHKMAEANKAFSHYRW